MNFEKRDCEQLVRQQLQLQKWQLLDANTLTERVWQAWLVNEGKLEAHEFVHRTVWKEYAIFLHDCLCAADVELHQRAWQELNDWMWGQIGRITVDETEQTWVIQQALVSLQKKLQRESLIAPRALWAYILQAMRRKLIDYIRQQNREREVSLNQENGSQMADEKATPEETVTLRDGQAQLVDFLHTHTNSDLQQLVAVYSFIDGMPPREIAQKLGKKPHQIRLTKANVVQKLRQLPSADMQQLMDLLNP